MSPFHCILSRHIGKVSQFFFKFSAILYLVHTRIF